MEKRNGMCVATIISGLSLLISVICFMMVLGYCYPNLEQDIKAFFAGYENNTIQQAFHVMTKGLEEGASIQTAMKETAEVLFA